MNSSDTSAVKSKAKRSRLRLQSVEPPRPLTVYEDPLIQIDGKSLPIPMDMRGNLVFRQQMLQMAKDSRQWQGTLLTWSAKSIVFWISVFGWTFRQKEVVEGQKKQVMGESAKTPFIPRPKQVELLKVSVEAIHEGFDLLVDKSRDEGATWIIEMVFLHQWLFNKNVNFLMLSNKEENVDKKGNRKSLFWKALTLDTDILTPNGWVKNGDLTVGDNVVGSNGRSTKVLAVHDHGIKSVYRIEFSDGTHVRCCGDHLWTVTTTATRFQAWKHGLESAELITKTTDEMATTFVRNHKGHRPKYVYQIPLVDPVRFDSDETLPIPPYTLGALLGDGSLNGCGINLCGEDEEIFDRVKEQVPAKCAPVANGRCSRGMTGGRGAGGSWDRKHNPINHAIKTLGLKKCRAWDKFIPECYKFASIYDRVELLRGIMDTDGWVVTRTGPRGDKSHTYFETTSEQLARDMVELIRGLGGLCHEPASYPRTYNWKGQKRIGRKAYRISFICPFNPFHLKRKSELFRERPLDFKTIINIVPDGEDAVRCISVDAADSLYVVAGTTLTHNCMYALDNLPQWMKPRYERTHMHLENLDRGNVIDGESTNIAAGKSDRRTALLADEFAEAKEGYAIWGNTADVVDCKFWVSTPAGPGTCFSWLRNQAIKAGQPRRFELLWHQNPEKAHDLHYDYLDWYDDKKPRLTSTWYENECRLRNYDKKFIAQNIDADHEQAGDTFFDLNVIAKQVQVYAEPSRRSVRRGYIRYQEVEHHHTIDKMLRDQDDFSLEFIEDERGPWRIWCDLDPMTGRPHQETRYAGAADIGQGTGSSNTVMCFGDVSTGRKVAEFCSPIYKPYMAARMFIMAAIWFGGGDIKPMLGWEANGPGGEFGDEIWDLSYPRIWFMRDTGTNDAERKNLYGWHSNKDRKKKVAGQYRQALAGEQFINPSAEALQEAAEYIVNESGQLVPAMLKDTPEGGRAEHGDRVIADMLLWLVMSEEQSSIDRSEKIETGSILWHRQQRKIKERKQRLESSWLGG